MNSSLPNKLILTPEQKIVRQHQQRMSEAGQADRYATAISRALNAANEDVAAEGGKPSLTAVLEALAGGAAYYCCQAGDVETRGQLVDLVTRSLHSQVAHISAGGGQG